MSPKKSTQKKPHAAIDPRHAAVLVVKNEKHPWHNREVRICITRPGQALVGLNYHYALFNKAPHLDRMILKPANLADLHPVGHLS